MKTRQCAFSAEGSASHLAHTRSTSCRADTLPNAYQLDDAGNASLGEMSPTVEESGSSLSPRGAHASRCVSGCAVSRVARDGSLQEARLTGVTDELWAPSAHGNVTA